MKNVLNWEIRKDIKIGFLWVFLSENFKMATLETIVVMRPNSVHGDDTKIEGKRTQYWPIGVLLVTDFTGEERRVNHKGKNESREVYWTPTEESVEREGMVILVKSCYEAEQN